MNSQISREDIEPVLIKLSGWLSKPNIVGLNVSNKWVANKKTDHLAIVVYVKNKKPVLSPEDFPIPKCIEIEVQDSNGKVTKELVPTDVAESGSFKEQSQCTPPDLDVYQRPCPGGYQIEGNGLGATGCGTLGVNTVFAGKFSLLSCNHVISHNGKHKNSKVWQPKQDDDNSKYILAKKTQFIKVKSYKNEYKKKPIENKYDIAWADIAYSAAASEIPCIGTIKGIRKPVVGETIKVLGKTTQEVKSANIISIHGIEKFCSNAFGGWVTFVDLIQLDSLITEAGDSGAAYVGHDNYVVGLHMGYADGSGSQGKFSYGCWIPS